MLLAAGSALILWARLGIGAPGGAGAQPQAALGTDTARLLDNFEQRFAELKGRKADATVLGDLYALGTQLEQRGRGRRPPRSTGIWRASTTPTATSPRASSA